jgi:putative endopeptidase
MYRGNGPVSNLPQFYDAFGVRPGDKLYREEKDRVQIW